MPVVIDATPGGPSANCYELASEADAYFDSRIAIIPPWVPGGVDSSNRALVMGTRVLEMMSVPHKKLMRQSYKGGVVKYYLVSPSWTGLPSTTTQRLAWPRVGMLDRQNRAIDPTVIPQELKDALSELAGQLIKVDRTIDNEIMYDGIDSVSASGVSIKFNEREPWVIPGAVWDLMPQSWFTDELYQPAELAEFDVVKTSLHGYRGRDFFVD